MRPLVFVFVVVVVLAGCGGDSVAVDGGQDGTTGDVATADVQTGDGSAAADVESDVSAQDAGPDAATLGIACAAPFPTEVFRDDFSGAAIDTSVWDVASQKPGGGTFTQLTTMIAANVTVSNGTLHVASQRHCTDPYPNGAAANPAQCNGTNYYSGGWIRAKNGYSAGKGLVKFLAKIPAPVQGTFPALWARNTQTNPNYGELDLIEQWWDSTKKGTAGDPNGFSSTTWLADGTVHTSSNAVGPVTNLDGAFHVFEAEWDGTSTTATIGYYYRDSPAAARTLLRTVDATTAGVSGNVTNAALKTILGFGFRPYVDFAVNPDTAYHVGPDTATTYGPADLEVDSVIVCGP